MPPDSTIKVAEEPPPPKSTDNLRLSTGKGEEFRQKKREENLNEGFSDRRTATKKQLEIAELAESL